MDLGWLRNNANPRQDKTHKFSLLLVPGRIYGRVDLFMVPRQQKGRTFIQYVEISDHFSLLPYLFVIYEPFVADD